jgi:type IV secretory pathway VirB10-like protein
MENNYNSQVTVNVINNNVVEEKSNQQQGRNNKGGISNGPFMSSFTFKENHCQAAPSERQFREKELHDNKEFQPNLYNLNSSDRHIVEKETKDMESLESKADRHKDTELEKEKEKEKEEIQIKADASADVTVNSVQPKISDDTAKKKEDLFNRLDKLNLENFSPLNSDNNSKTIFFIFNFSLK